MGGPDRAETALVRSALGTTAYPFWSQSDATRIRLDGAGTVRGTELHTFNNRRRPTCFGLPDCQGQADPTVRLRL